MSENIMYKNIADKMKKANEGIKELKETINKKEAMYDSLAVDYRLANEKIEELKRENEDYKSRNEKAVEIYDETITYLTTINGEYMDSNTKRTIQDIVNKLEKELDILNGKE